MATSVIHLFIDTNVLLSFYAHSNDDIEELKQIVGLIKSGQVKLYFTEQVRSEFMKNREKKLSESIQNFIKHSFKVGIPRFMMGYDDVTEFQTSIKAAETARTKLENLARKEAEEAKLAV